MLTAIGAALAVLVGFGAALGIASAAGKGVDAIARQPEKASEIRALSFLGMVLIEACAIYGLLIALMLAAKV